MPGIQKSAVHYNRVCDDTKRCRVGTGRICARTNVLWGVTSGIQKVWQPKICFPGQKPLPVFANDSCRCLWPMCSSAQATQRPDGTPVRERNSGGGVDSGQGGPGRAKSLLQRVMLLGRTWGRALGALVPSLLSSDHVTTRTLLTPPVADAGFLLIIFTRFQTLTGLASRGLAKTSQAASTVTANFWNRHTVLFFFSSLKCFPIGKTFLLLLFSFSFKFAYLLPPVSVKMLKMMMMMIFNKLEFSWLEICCCHSLLGKCRAS